MGYGAFRPCDGCRKLPVYEPREPVVPRDEGAVDGFKGFDGAFGEGRLDPGGAFLFMVLLSIHACSDK